MTDVLIIGSGPAALSAAINVRARGRSCTVIGNPPTDSPLWRAERIDNYPGLRGRTGAEVLAVLRREAEEAGAEFVNKRVVALAPSGDGFTAATEDEMFEGHRAILAIGAAQPKPLAGERELIGRGVSYCATCDGMLYRGRRAVVTGSASDLAEEAAFLQRIGVEVTVVTRRAVDGLPETVPARTARDIRLEAENGRLAAVTADGDRIPADAVFILRPMLAPDALTPGLKVENGFIAVDRRMEANIPGLYGAGDCTGRPLQIAKAVGEGVIAAQNAAGEE